MGLRSLGLRCRVSRVQGLGPEDCNELDPTRGRVYNGHGRQDGSTHRVEKQNLETWPPSSKVASYSDMSPAILRNGHHGDMYTVKP